MEDHLHQLQQLLPTLTPNLYKMKAADWVRQHPTQMGAQASPPIYQARLLHDVSHTAACLIAFKSIYPGVDAAAVVKTTPKLLLKAPQQLESEATQVAWLLRGLEPHERDTILEAVPCLTDPGQLSQALAFLQHSFPNQVRCVRICVHGVS